MRAKAIVLATHLPPQAPDDPIDNTNWSDLRIGQRCTLDAFLDSVGYGAPGTLLLRFGDWATLVVDCDMPRDTTPIAIGSRVNVRAERTEDGLHAIAIWNEGSVPIPLRTRQ